MKAFALILVLFLSAACGIDKKVSHFIDDVKSIKDAFKIDLSQGNFRVIIVDAPFAYDNVTKARIKIVKLEAKNTDGDYIVAFSGEKELDLVLLRNGGYSILVDLDFTPGHYSEVKLYISEASVELSDGRTLPITLPVGVTQGVSVGIDQTVKVEAKGKTDILVDIDLSKSFLPNGDISELSKVTGFEFFPVMRAVSLKGTGQLGGKIVNQLKEPITGAIVEIHQGSMTSGTITKEDGTFLIVGLPLGEYKFTAKANGHMPKPEETVQVEKAGLNVFGTYLVKQP